MKLETLQDYELETLQDYELETLQDYKLETLQDYELETLQDYKLETLQDYKLETLQDYEGSVGCRECDRGSYSDVAGLDECKVCPPGTSQVRGRGHETDMIATSCNYRCSP